MSRVLLNYIYIFCHLFIFLFFFFNDTATTEIYTLSLHDALPISMQRLVENLLDMARLQQGGVHLQREWLPLDEVVGDRKSTRLNSSHLVISYAVFCLKKKKKQHASTCDCILYPLGEESRRRSVRC